MRVIMTRLLLLMLLLSCSASRPTSPPSLLPDPDFAKAGKALADSDNWCFGEAQLLSLDKELGQSSLPEKRRCEALAELSGHQLRLGRSEEALRSIETALKTAQEKPEIASVVESLLLQRAVVYLRLGELANCVDGHCQASCIFPLQGQGVHQNKAPAEKSLADLLAVVSQQEQPPAVERWLLNLVAMQTGRYPDALPQQFRLPERLWQVSPQTSKRFEDVALAAGLQAQDMCGGTVVEDIDGDGLLDIVSSSASYTQPVRYYRNLGNGHFEDLTEPAGLAAQTGAFNVRAADYDGDGDMDLLLLRGAFLRELGRVRRSLMQNNGKGRFQDVSRQAGLAVPAYPTGTAAWGDFDGDGHLDVFIANESTDPVNKPYPCQLFRNNGDGTFSDIAAKAGVAAIVYAKGVAVGDFDNDGRQDIFITDFSHRDLPHPTRRGNMLFHNKGDGTFQEVSSQMGIEGPPSRAFGTWFFDYDNDGWLDLFVASYEAQQNREVRPYLGWKPSPGRTCLYRNDQGRRFVNVSQEVGLTGVYSTMGCSFGDIDHDGYLDMYFGTGAPRFDYLVPNVMLRNVGARKFEDVTLETGLGHLQKGHGIAFADFDHDGDQDIYSQLGGTFPGDNYFNALFANPGQGSANHFLYLKLSSSRSVLGARIKVELDNPGGPKELHRAVGFMSSFGHTPYRQEIGLGQARAIRAIEVRWPSGTVQRFRPPPMDSQLELVENAPEARLLDMKSFTLGEAGRHSH
jgi:hypothetical protein